VRDAAAQLIAAAKESGVVVLLIGHVTKDGAIAGPKSLEHMVDVVLALDGDAHRNLRFLRGTKNRFGSVHEIGVFEMTDHGLDPVVDPSAVLAGTRETPVAGSVLFPALDGRRSLLVEIQALVVPTTAAQPRRSVKGLAASRVHQVIASIDRHGKIAMGGREVYVSAMGGISIGEPAADLPMALAIASAVSEVPLGSVAAWGEVALTGEVRSVSRADRRHSESRRLGVDHVVQAGDGRSLHDVFREVGVIPGESEPGNGLRAIPIKEGVRS
jgi:DNA repair protein RadA/Sms